MYRIISQNWYILQSDHHHKSSCHPSQYSWSPSPMLPTSQSPSHQVTANLFSMRVFSSVHCFLLDSIYLSLSDLFHLISSRFIMLSQMAVHSFIYGWIALCYPIVCLTHILICVCVWTSLSNQSIDGHIGCFHIGYCKYCCNEHRECIFSN